MISRPSRVSTHVVNRRVVLKIVLSFDGFATSLDGTHDWMFEFFCDHSGWNQRALDQAGTHAMGRPRRSPAGHGRHPRRRVIGQTTATAVPVQVHLVLPDRVLLGQAEDAAELHGYGPTPPSWPASLFSAGPSTRACGGSTPPRLPAASSRWTHRPVRVLQPRQTSGRLALPDPTSNDDTRETTTPTDHTYRSRAPATWPAAPPLAPTGSTSCSAPSSGSPPERRKCRRPRLASDPWQPCCPSCS